MEEYSKHTALRTMDQVPIYGLGWREAQLVLAPSLRELSQKVAADGFEPAITRSAVYRLQPLCL